jgi:hypothetical protein
LLAQCGLHRDLDLGDDLPMAIQFARARYISRSNGSTFSEVGRTKPAPPNWC